MPPVPFLDILDEINCKKDLPFCYIPTLNHKTFNDAVENATGV
jgi:hypothetical protein